MNKARLHKKEQINAGKLLHHLKDIHRELKALHKHIQNILAHLNGGK